MLISRKVLRHVILLLFPYPLDMIFRQSKSSINESISDPGTHFPTMNRDEAFFVFYVFARDTVRGYRDRVKKKKKKKKSRLKSFYVVYMCIYILQG